MPPIVALLKQVLFDVRSIKCGNACTVFLEILANLTQRRWSGEITHQRHNEIFPLHLPYELKVLFVGEIASRLSLVVCRGHQIRIAHSSESAEAAGIIEPSSRIEDGPINVIDRSLVLGGEPEPVIFHQPILDCLQVPAE